MNRARYSVVSLIVSSSPTVLHVVRPYRSVDEYLAAEAWTIDAKAMVLIGTEDLPPDTAVLFDVALQSGDKLIRAEGKVAGKIAAAGDRPAGLRVRFKRYGGTTKAFIDRAIQYARQGGAASSPVSSVQPVSVERISVPDVEPPLAASPPAPVVDPPAPVADPPAPPPAPVTAAAAEPSGVHRRPVAPVDVPPNREALLARLRDRARSVDLDSFGPRNEKQTG